MQICNLKVDKQVEETIHSMTERYTKAMCPQSLDAFSISNLDNIPTNIASSEFSLYGHSKINVLSNHLFANQKENKDTFIKEWENFKFDLMSVRKKMGQSERKLVNK